MCWLHILWSGHVSWIQLALKNKKGYNLQAGEIKWKQCYCAALARFFFSKQRVLGKWRKLVLGYFLFPFHHQFSLFTFHVLLHPCIVIFGHGPMCAWSSGSLKLWQWLPFTQCAHSWVRLVAGDAQMPWGPQPFSRDVPQLRWQFVSPLPLSHLITKTCTLTKTKDCVQCIMQWLNHWGWPAY